jgi:hypothetical protein
LKKIVFKPKKVEFSIYKLDFNSDLLNLIKQIAEKVDSSFFLGYRRCI